VVGKSFDINAATKTQGVMNRVACQCSHCDPVGWLPLVERGKALHGWVRRGDVVWSDDERVERQTFTPLTPGSGVLRLLVGQLVSLLRLARREERGRGVRTDPLAGALRREGLRVVYRDDISRTRTFRTNVGHSRGCA
jgi:hypothetical protein